MPFWHIDTGMAARLILLTAVDDGLGALFFGIVPDAVVPFRAAFGVPDGHEPIGAIAIATKRKRHDAICPLGAGQCTKSSITATGDDISRFRFHPLVAPPEG